MSELDEINDIIDDETNVPEGAELDEEEKTSLREKMKALAKEVYDEEMGESE